MHYPTKVDDDGPGRVYGGSVPWLVVAAGLEVRHPWA